MSKPRCTACLIIAFALASCAERGEEITAEPDAVADTLADPAHDPPAGLDRPPGGLGEPTRLQALSGDEVGGDLVVNDRGDQSEVEVRLTGGAPAAEHLGHIHTGTCTAIGDVVEPLEPIATDSSGTGSMTTEVNRDPLEIMDGRHVVVYHRPDGSPLACAAIPLPEVEDPSSTI